MQKILQIMLLEFLSSNLLLQTHFVFCNLLEKEKENKLDLKKVPKSEFKVLIKELSEQMQLAAANLEYEKAAEIRDMIQKIKDEEEKRKS